MNALVLGSARTLLPDVENLERMAGPWRGIVIAVNRAAIGYTGRVDHWASLHAKEFPKWRAERGDRGDAPVLWSRVHAKDSEHYGFADRTAPHWRGSSGLFAVSVAMELGATRIVLCGIPLDTRGHFDTDRPWLNASNYVHDWRKRFSTLRGTVRSMSGWTASVLGRPTKAWLQEKEVA